MTPQQFTELRPQKEIIEHWLNTPGIPADAHAKLLEMLSDVNEKMISLIGSNTHLDDAMRTALILIVQQEGTSGPKTNE